MSGRHNRSRTVKLLHQPWLIYKQTPPPWDLRVTPQFRSNLTGVPKPLIRSEVSLSISVSHVSVSAIRQASLYSRRWSTFPCNSSVLFLRDWTLARIIEGRGTRFFLRSFLTRWRTPPFFPRFLKRRGFPKLVFDRENKSCLSLQMDFSQWNDLQHLLPLIVVLLWSNNNRLDDTGLNVLAQRSLLLVLLTTRDGALC